MKKANFNTLKNLPVPEGWVEKALMIPANEAEKPAVLPLWRRKGVIALAASLILVTAVSAALFLSGGDTPPVTVKPMPSETVSETNEIGGTVVPDATLPNGDLPTSAPSQATGETTSLSGGALPTDPTAPTEKKSSAATENGATETRRPEPSAKPTTPSTKPTESDSQRATDPPRPTAAPQRSTTAPTERSTVSPTVPTWDAPTDAPWERPTETTWVHPTETTWEPPKPTEPPYQATIFADIVKYYVRLGDNDKIYCRIYDSDGNLCGDSDLYSAQHVSEVTENGIFESVSYTPRDHGILPADGTYRYEFYNQNGRVFLFGSKKLSAS